MTAIARPPVGLAPADAARKAARARVWARGQLAFGVALAVGYLVTVGLEVDQIAVLLVGLGAAVAVIWPASGLAMLILVTPMLEPEILVPIRTNAVLAGATLLGCALRLPFDRRPMHLHPGVILLIGYVALSFLSIAPAISGDLEPWWPSALNEAVRFASGVAFFLSAAYLFRTVPAKPYLTLGFAAALVVGLLAAGDMTGVPPLPSIVQGLIGHDTGERAGGTFSDPNFLGLYLATVIVFGAGAFGALRSGTRLAVGLIVIVLVAALALSYSRGAYVGAMAGIVTLIWFRNRGAAIMSLVAVLVVAVLLYPVFLEFRQGQALGPMDLIDQGLSEGSRRAVVEAGFVMFLSAPILGFGFGTFQFLSAAYLGGARADTTFSHNQFVEILAEQGIVGTLLVATMVVVAAIELERSAHPLRYAAMAMGVALMVTSAFLHSTSSFQALSFAWLALAVTFSPWRTPNGRTPATTMGET